MSPSGVGLMPCTWDWALQPLPCQLQGTTGSRTSKEPEGGPRGGGQSFLDQPEGRVSSSWDLATKTPLLVGSAAGGEVPAPSCSPPVYTALVICLSHLSQRLGSPTAGPHSGALPSCTPTSQAPAPSLGELGFSGWR